MLLNCLWYLTVSIFFIRYEKIKEAFHSKFGCSPEFYARAPGRVNIIGKGYYVCLCGHTCMW